MNNHALSIDKMAICRCAVINDGILKNFIFFIFLFIYLINIKLLFSNLPVFYFLSPLGLLLLGKDFLTGKVYKGIVNFFMLIFIFFVIGLISFLVNQYNDFFFFREFFIYTILSLFYVRFLVYLYFKFFPAGNIDKILYLGVFCVFLQLSLSLAAFLNPAFYNILFSIFSDNVQLDNVESFAKMRLIALGTPFFGSAILNCFILIVAAEYLIKNEKKYLFFLMVLVIMMLGLFSARSTMFGIICFVLLVLTQFFNKSTYKYFVFGGGVLFLGSIVFSSYLQNLDALIKFGFGFLIDFSSSQASDSVSDLQSMYKILPNNIKTWLIGDSLYRDVNTGFYYQATDVGFLRIIFVNGIIGLIIFLSIHFYVLLAINKKYISTIAKLLLAGILVVLNAKGVTNLLPYLLLIYLFSIYDPNKIKV